MKKQTSPTCCLPTRSGRRAAGSGLVVALCLLLSACSSSDPPISSPADPASGGASPIGTPSEAPPENDGPGATETNFITPPCHADADCGDGRRCVDESDRSLDAGVSDAGVLVGHCVAAGD
jgi:hypothetical protein